MEALDTFYFWKKHSGQYIPYHREKCRQSRPCHRGKTRHVRPYHTAQTIPYGVKGYARDHTIGKHPAIQTTPYGGHTGQPFVDLFFSHNLNIIIWGRAIVKKPCVNGTRCVSYMRYCTAWTLCLGKCTSPLKPNNKKEEGSLGRS